ncbi:MAG TPA: hypothetical protein VLB83_05175 [Candidatus Paceibacterota bacterium]|nr:hypothetical protein [Candidatus Paceibacterota bacterium]
MTLSFAPFPSDLAGWSSEIAIGLALVYVFGSLFEWGVHRYIMHTDFFAHVFPSVRKHADDRIFHKHAVLHHGTYYHAFDREDDPIGREISIVFTIDDTARVLAGFVPVAFVIALVSPVIAIIFVLTPIVHNQLWNLMHREMHQPRHPWWSRMAVFCFLARHHFLHHTHNGTNYNVVLPLADHLLGTLAFATASDRAEMERLGFTRGSREGI